MGFDSFGIAEKAICGIQIMHIDQKGPVEKIQCALSEIGFLNKIMGIAA